MGERLRVYIRIRPLLHTEREESNLQDIAAQPAFSFDGLFKPSDSTGVVFDTILSSRIPDVVRGFPCALLTYGMTSSGKTHTCLGNSSDPGLVPRALQILSSYVAHKGTLKFSLMEIYQEKVYDLIEARRCPPGAEPKALAIKGISPRFFVEGLSQYVVQSEAEALRVIDESLQYRRMGSSNLNKDRSSRSHAIIRFNVSMPSPSSAARALMGQLTIVDLAGCERQMQRGGSKTQEAERRAINKSLSTLNLTLMSLSRGKKAPYRDSALTKVLADALGGNCKTSMLCCVSPAKEFMDEAKRTLEYGLTAKNVMNTPQVCDRPIGLTTTEARRALEEERALITAANQAIETQQQVIESLRAQLAAGARSAALQTRVDELEDALAGKAKLEERLLLLEQRMEEQNATLLSLTSYRSPFMGSSFPPAPNSAPSSRPQSPDLFESLMDGNDRMSIHISTSPLVDFSLPEPEPEFEIESETFKIEPFSLDEIVPHAPLTLLETPTGGGAVEGPSAPPPHSSENPLPSRQELEALLHELQDMRSLLQQQTAPIDGPSQGNGKDPEPMPKLVKRFSSRSAADFVSPSGFDSDGSASSDLNTHDSVIDDRERGDFGYTADDSRPLPAGGKRSFSPPLRSSSSRNPSVASSPPRSRRSRSRSKSLTRSHSRSSLASISSSARPSAVHPHPPPPHPPLPPLSSLPRHLVRQNSSASSGLDEAVATETSSVSSKRSVDKFSSRSRPARRRARSKPPIGGSNNSGSAASESETEVDRAMSALHLHRLRVTRNGGGSGSGSGSGEATTLAAKLAQWSQPEHAMAPMKDDEFDETGSPQTTLSRDWWKMPELSTAGSINLAKFSSLGLEEQIAVLNTLVSPERSPPGGGEADSAEQLVDWAQDLGYIEQIVRGRLSIEEIARLSEPEVEDLKVGDESELASKAASMTVSRCQPVHVEPEVAPDLYSI